ncbi:MAG TPA: hypothetical protein VM328_04480 [Fimbriimonadaceae bacterium]|nr:hypothetical protein [Fimbriimonadaceae bacterium]
MPKVVGGFAALAALAAGVLFQVEPLTTLQRALLAFLLGFVGTQAWYVFFAVRIQSNTESNDREMPEERPKAA